MQNRGLARRPHSAPGWMTPCEFAKNLPVARICSQNEVICSLCSVLAFAVQALQHVVSALPYCLLSLYA